jgi:glycerate 2-kinase
MRVLLAFDKFKDALTAAEACAAAAAALRGRHPDWQLDLCPLTDGGEGFCETLSQAGRGNVHRPQVSAPRGGTVAAPHGLIAMKNIPVAARRQMAIENREPKITDSLAVVDLASASGLALLAPALRDPWHTTTRGTGELLGLAADTGAAAIVLGLGGSATNDLGCGALAALGCKFLDAAGSALAPPTPATWENIRGIDATGARPLPPLYLACDVTNPLLGPRGATATFGPQKGLRSEDVSRLEAQAARMAALLCAAYHQPLDRTETPGAGAAGGIAFGLMVAYGARLVPGFDLVSDWLDLPARLDAADLVLTGEGRFDATSLGGKGPGSLVAEARRRGKAVHVFAGSLGVPADPQFHAITPPDLPLAAALPRTAELLAAAVARTL